MESRDDSKGSGNIVELNSFRKKKEIEQEVARGRKPLYLSHLDGKVTGSPHFKRPEGQDFGDRLQRIRTSLEKINRLMAELRRMSRQKEEEWENAQGSGSRNK